MQSKDFYIFSHLLTQVYSRAFGEELTHLPYGKAVCLSWMIYDQTGILISYKSLGAYVRAVLEKDAQQVNPNNSTLGVLASYAGGNSNAIRGSRIELTRYWYHYRGELLKHNDLPVEIS